MAEDMALARRPSGLGRGLSSLMGELTREEPIAGGVRGGVELIALSEIDADPQQPRRFFGEEALEELAQSILARGLLQPIVVRPAGSRYQIVAGERRWRAAMRAGLRQMPAIVRAFRDSETLEVALLENIQREDLNAIEEARGYRRLMQDFGHSQESLGKLVHKSRSHIANLLRLLDLPETVQAWLGEGKLTMGHARALATADDPEALARRAIDGGLSVRAVERIMQDRRPVRTRKPPAPAADASDIGALERQLGDMLGLKVRINHAANGGSVLLSYATLDQLDMICQRLSGEPI